MILLDAADRMMRGVRRTSTRGPQDSSEPATVPWQRTAPEAIRRLDPLVDPDYTGGARFVVELPAA